MNASFSNNEPLFNWLSSRSSGLLLHPTALPGEQGCGVLNQAVDRLLDFLQVSGIGSWQICPLGHTGFGDSPYQCFSAFAGNPYLIDLAPLVADGLISASDVATLHQLPCDRVDFSWLHHLKWPMLFAAHEAFLKKQKHTEAVSNYGSFAEFKAANEIWLTPYSLFMALKDQHKGQAWWDWPKKWRDYASACKQPKSAELANRADAYAFFQYLFFAQWKQVRGKAADRGIQIIGDAPIFVAADGADVWSNSSLFQLNPETKRTTFVAGVPPDYFSADGQLWGNPLYEWSVHEATGFSWWISRLKTLFELCDIVRIDHFRAFDTYWSIPAGASNARGGEWKPGPGLNFFKVLKEKLPDARLIAEDLGDLSPSVHELRDATGLPGMAILQFAFGGDASNLYLPHNLKSNSVIYPGTHDNDTTRGWYQLTDDKTRDHVRRYFRVSGDEISWDFIRASYASVSNLAVFALQDLLSLDSEARFNTPGTPVGNWQWRYQDGDLAQLKNQSSDYLRTLKELYGR